MVLAAIDPWALFVALLLAAAVAIAFVFYWDDRL